MANEFDQLFGIDQAVEDELNGFLSKTWKKIKRVRKKLTPKILRKPISKLGKLAGKVVTHPAFKWAATAAASMVGAGALVYSGINAASIAGKAVKGLNAYKGYKKGKKAVKAAKRAVVPVSPTVAKQLGIPGAKFITSKIPVRSQGIPDLPILPPGSPAFTDFHAMAKHGITPNQFYSLSAFDQKRFNGLSNAYSLRPKYEMELDRLLTWTLTRPERRPLPPGFKLPAPAPKPIPKTPPVPFKPALTTGVKIGQSPRFEGAINALKQKGFTDSQIEQQWLTSETFRKVALPKASDAAILEYQNYLKAKGDPDWQAKGAALGLKEGKKAVDEIQKDAGKGAGGIAILLPLALLAMNA